MSKSFTVNRAVNIEPCPKCGNETEFNAKSQQCAIDHCNVWVWCGECGYDPTEGKTRYRYEDVWGGVNESTVRMALSVWNDLIREQKEKEDNVST